MRKLTDAEIEEFLDDNSESENGAVAIEISVKELRDLQVGTLCGGFDNRCFCHMSKFNSRLVKGWFGGYKNTFVMMGMIHIQCSEEEAAEIQQLAYEHDGSLRSSGQSLLRGYWEFENE